ncbi:MAG: glycogen-binding domain-containing protein [Phycisphaerales bacterium]|nr:glycogen-binding domain-containing protein [Phycisphaerales bacterium]
MSTQSKNHAPASNQPRNSVSTTAPDAKAVFVAGTFNDWNPQSHPLTRTRDGRWALTLDVPPGRYEYKFIIDGQWCCEPGSDKPFDGCPECVANEMGTMNRVLVVEQSTEQSRRQPQLA